MAPGIFVSPTLLERVQVLRVDGHTDKVPIQNLKFASNWELSAARAISVVKFLVSQGVPANRLGTGSELFCRTEVADSPAGFVRQNAVLGRVP